jgi:hypothetical protein
MTSDASKVVERLTSKREVKGSNSAIFQIKKL